MAPRQFRIGIAGCGKVARLHARAIEGIPQAKLVAAWSRDPRSASAFAQEFGVQTVTHVSAFGERLELDLAIICTPHPFHIDPAIEAAQAGVNVLVEKPLAACLQHCDQIIVACEASGVKLGVVSQRRWYEPCVRLKKAIEAGKIGRPALGAIALHGWRDQAYYEQDAWRGAWSTEGGGVLVNQAPHLMDLLLWYMGPLAEVYGLWDNVNHPGIEVEDTAVATLRFRNGGLGSLVVSNSQNPGLYGRTSVHGSNGASVGVQSEGGSMFIAGSTGIAEAPFNDLWTISGEQELLRKWEEEDRSSFFLSDPTTRYIGLQISDFLEAIDHDRRPAVDGEAGRAVVELFTAIYQSAREKRPISLPIPPSQAT